MKPTESGLSYTQHTEQLSGTQIASMLVDQSCTPPKWLQARLLIPHALTVNSLLGLKERAPYIEGGWAASSYSLADFNADNGRARVFKSHCSWKNFPCMRPLHPSARVIVVTRDPRDVAVSLYHHERALTGKILSYLPGTSHHLLAVVWLRSRFELGGSFR